MEFMETVTEFINNNIIIVAIVGVFLIISSFGYFADKSFKKKHGIKPKKKKKKLIVYDDYMKKNNIELAKEYAFGFDDTTEEVENDILYEIDDANNKFRKEAFKNKKENDIAFEILEENDDVSGVEHLNKDDITKIVTADNITIGNEEDLNRDKNIEENVVQQEELRDYVVDFTDTTQNQNNNALYDNQDIVVGIENSTNIENNTNLFDNQNTDIINNEPSFIIDNSVTNQDELINNNIQEEVNFDKANNEALEQNNHDITDKIDLEKYKVNDEYVIDIDESISDKPKIEEIEEDVKEIKEKLKTEKNITAKEENYNFFDTNAVNNIFEKK